MKAPSSGWVARWAILLAVTALWLALGTQFVAGIWIVSGPSMEPTLHPGDWVLVDRWTLRQRPAKTGEVVLLVFPGENRSTGVKRVVDVKNDGTRFDVRGDNPEWSRDSRDFGLVDRHHIFGRVVESR